VGLLDWLVILAYFGGLFGLIGWVTQQSRQTAAGYSAASHNLGWFIVGASILASNIELPGRPKHGKRAVAPSSQPL
jgi:SSS family solute:Na+ symporter